MFYFSQTYFTYFLFALPALLLAFYAQMKVRAAYDRWLRVPNQRGLSGTEAAQFLLRANFLGPIGIEGSPGQLTDHYDPRSKSLHLSQGVANSRSVASLAIVAHELGHAAQDAADYTPLKLRSAIVPAVQVSSYAAPLMFLLGMLMQFTPLIWLGVLFFGAAVVFAVVTLPVELNASSRAIAMLRDNSLLASPEEEAGARSVLNAAALTYVAALAQALMTLLFYISLAGGNRRRG